MAIYHCSIKNIGRSDGRSAVACSAYRAAQKLRDKETGLLYDFTKKSEVIYSKIFLCKNAPAAYVDRETLWNEVQKIEKNKNARLAREWELAIPHELTFEQSKKLVCDFAKTLVDEGMCVDVNIHWKNNNHHAHIMGTTRQIKENGKWGQKEKKVYKLDENGQKIAVLDADGKQKIGANGRKLWQREAVETNDWNKSDKVEEWRKRWAECCNQYLDLKNQVDHRSYERQGIDYIATIHEGYTARLIEKRGGIAERCEINREIVKKNNLLRTLRQQLREVNEKITELIGEKGKQANERISRLLNRAGRTAHQRARNSHQSERGTIAGDNKPTGTTFEERLSKLRSARTSGTLEKESLRTGRTTEPQKDLAEERLASLRSHKPSRGMEEPSREIGDTDTETLIREARAGIDSSRTREENSGADRANREAERSRQRAEAQRRAEEAKREAEARQAQRRARSRSYGIER